MKLRTLLAAVATTTAATVAVAAPAVATKKAPPPKTPAPSEMTIADLLLADAATDDAHGFDHNKRDFDIVTQAVLDAGLGPAAGGDGPLTVFAPTDQAFRLLVWDLTGKWYWREKDVYTAVGSLGADTVKNVLLYHIVPAAIPARDALNADGVALDTLLVPTAGGPAATFTVDVIGRWHGIIRLKDNDPNATNPWVTSFNVGGALKNGYVHGINRVLRPVDLPPAATPK
jgi:uncharacterized surface protein with fasciclin (FAS1) repeats